MGFVALCCRLSPKLSLKIALEFIVVWGLCIQFQKAEPIGTKETYKVELFGFSVGAVFFEQMGQLIDDLVEEPDDFLEESFVDFTALGTQINAFYRFTAVFAVAVAILVLIDMAKSFLFHEGY